MTLEQAFENLARLQEFEKSQRQWIDTCGRNLAGYVARYGSLADEDHYGDGGEAIYFSDRSALTQIRHRLVEAEETVRRMLKEIAERRKKQLSISMQPVMVH